MNFLTQAVALIYNIYIIIIIIKTNLNDMLYCDDMTSNYITCCYNLDVN
jgi:hypothetical protein